MEKRVTTKPGATDGATTPSPADGPAPGAPDGRARDLGVLALVVLGPVWGYGWVVTKVALGYSPALTFATSLPTRVGTRWSNVNNGDCR